MLFERGQGNLTVLFCIAAAAFIIFFAVSMFKDIVFVRESITEEVTISGKIDNKCIVDTSDSVMSSKIVNNCDLETGGKVNVIYKKGLSTAELVSP